MEMTHSSRNRHREKDKGDDRGLQQLQQEQDGVKVRQDETKGRADRRRDEGGERAER